MAQPQKTKKKQPLLGKTTIDTNLHTYGQFRVKKENIFAGIWTMEGN